jgi:hypothetical protein
LTRRLERKQDQLQVGSTLMCRHDLNSCCARHANTCTANGAKLNLQHPDLSLGHQGIGPSIRKVLAGWRHQIAQPPARQRRHASTQGGAEEPLVVVGKYIY